MRYKNFNVLGILFLFGILFFSMNFVSAEVTNFTILNPVANANVTGTFTAIANATNLTGVLNVSVRWWNGTLGNWAILCANASVATNGNVTCAFSTSALNANVSSSIFNMTVVETGGVAANSTNITGIVIDNTAPVITIRNYVNGTYRTSLNLTLNITLSDINMTNGMACIVEINGTNKTISLDVDNATFGTCNTTSASLLGSNDGNTSIKVYAGRNTTFFSSNLFGVNNSQVVFIDRNAPSLEAVATELTKSEITLAISTTDGTGTGTNTCTADRSGATVTTTSLTESALNCATTYTYILTCTDRAGNAGTLSKTFSTNACGASTTSSGASGTSTSKPVVSTVSEIKPGAASVVKFTDATTGLKQIEITVNNPAQNVQISVTKYDGKPAAVSVAKSGTVQYVQISTKNLADKMTGAKVQFQVEKSKVSNKDNVVISKFDETAKKWNDLSTTYSSADTKYYYYDVDVSSFSYFAISEKSLTSGAEGTGGTEGTAGTGGGGSLTWLWIVLGLVVLALVIWAVARKK